MRQWLGLPEVLSDGIKRADWLALFIEARALIPSKAEDWIAPEGIKEQAAELMYEIRCFNPFFAETQFRRAFERLRSG